MLGVLKFSLLKSLNVKKSENINLSLLPIILAEDVESNDTSVFLQKRTANFTISWHCKSE